MSKALHPRDLPDGLWGGGPPLRSRQRGKRRVENRLAGSDVNPYLAIAATLACGYLGMTGGLEPRAPVNGSAYDVPFALHRHFYESLDAFRSSGPMAEILGQDFVRVYCAAKEREFRDFEQRIPDWEHEELGLFV